MKMLMLHSDGALFPLIPLSIERRVDIVNLVRINALGMESPRLEQAFGDRLVCRSGAADCQETLPFGKAEDVAREAEANLKAFSPGGEHAFVAVHNTQAGVFPESILTLFETARGQ